VLVESRRTEHADHLVVVGKGVGDEPPDPGV